MNKREFLKGRAMTSDDNSAEYAAAMVQYWTTEIASKEHSDDRYFLYGRRDSDLAILRAWELRLQQRLEAEKAELERAWQFCPEAGIAAGASDE